VNCAWVSDTGMVDIRLLVRRDRIRTTAPQSTTTELKSLTEFMVKTLENKEQGNDGTEDTPSRSR
jgi:hypothetical protein